jgi:hypothetical protein
MPGCIHIDSPGSYLHSASIPQRHACDGPHRPVFRPPQHTRAF